MELGKEYFGPLWSFVASNEITDIDYNGKEIWLTNIFNERFRANQQFVTQYMTPAFVEVHVRFRAQTVQAVVKITFFSCCPCLTNCFEFTVSVFYLNYFESVLNGIRYHTT